MRNVIERQGSEVPFLTDFSSDQVRTLCQAPAGPTLAQGNVLPEQCNCSQRGAMHHK